MPRQPYQSVDDDASMHNVEIAGGLGGPSSRSNGSGLISAPMEWPDVWVKRKRPNWRFYLVAAVLYVLLDLPWLFANSAHVNRMFQDIQGEPLTFKPWAAIPVYVALAFIVSRPNAKMEAFLLGLSVYAVYDWTNYSTLNKYSLGFAIGDTVWGGVLTLMVYSIVTHAKLSKYIM